MPWYERLGLHFGFNSNEYAAQGKLEPMHIHVKKGNQLLLKIWIAKNGFCVAEITAEIVASDMKKIKKYVSKNRDFLVKEWLDYFGEGEFKQCKTIDWK